MSELKTTPLMGTSALAGIINNLTKVVDKINQSQTDANDALKELISGVQTDLTDLESRIDIADIYNMLNMLSDKIDDMKPEPSYVDAAAVGASYDAPVAISGDLAADMNTSGTVVLAELQSDAKRISIKADEVELAGNVSGAFPRTGSNSIVNVNDAKYVTVDHLNITPSEAYNGIEIGLSSTDKLPKYITIKNCTLGTFSNNVINLFKFMPDAVLNIENCTVESCSNFLRLSNANNCNITVNLKNCVIKKWDTTGWAGLICLQDYTSGEDYAAANQFAPSKVKINIINCEGPQGKITADMYPKESFGSQDPQKQLMYICVGANADILPYDEAIYPEVKIS